MFRSPGFLYKTLAKPVIKYGSDSQPWGKRDWSIKTAKIRTNDTYT
jgi:hypothetical protein